MNANWMPGVAALLGLTLAAVPSSADPIDSYGRGARARDYRYESYAARVASEKGYDDGLKRGRRDGDHGDRFDVTRDGKYRDGDHGYKSSYGPRWEYVRAYRRAFEQGYRDGFSRYYARDRYGRDGYYDRNGGYYGRDGGYYGRDDGYYRSSARYPFDAYDYQRDGRHRHPNQPGWCTIDHRYDERGRVYEIPR